MDEEEVEEKEEKMVGWMKQESQSQGICQHNLMHDKGDFRRTWMRAINFYHRFPHRKI